MNRRLNLRFLLKSVALVIIGAIAVHFLHAYQVRRNVDTFLDRAREALEKKEIDQALVYFQNYLAIRPADVEARADYSLALDRRARSKAARQRVLTEMERVLAAAPNRDDIRYRTVVNLIELGRIADAVPHIDSLLARSFRPAEMQHNLGWCLEATRKYPEAAKAFARAAELDPGRISTWTLWADVVLRLPPEDAANPHEPAERARALIDRMVAANAKNHEAYLARYRFLKDQGDAAEAKKNLDQAAALAPKQAAVLQALADWHHAAGDVKTSRALLQEALALHPADISIIKSLASLHIRAGAPEEAVKLLRKTLTDAPAAPELAVLLIELLIDQKQTDEAQARLDDLRAANLAAVMADYLKARLLVENGDWSNAVTLLERVRTELNPKSDWQGRVHALLGVCYHHLGDADAELTSFRRAVQHEPGWPKARFGLASALARTGRLDDALALCKELLHDKSTRDLEGLDLLVAQTLLWQTLREPESSRDWHAAAEAIERAEKRDPKAPELPLLRAELLAGQRQHAKAEALLVQARAAQPRNPAYWRLAADLAARQNRLADAALLLEEAEKTLGADVSLTLARIQLWARGGAANPEVQVSAFRRRVAALPALEQAQVLRALSEVCERAGETRLAEELWRDLATLKPRDIRSRAALLDLALARDDAAALRKLIDELRDLEGEDGMWWRYGAASLLIEEGKKQPAKLEQAQRLLDRLAQHHRDWARLALARARLADARNDPEAALAAYHEAVRLGDASPAVLRFLIQGLMARKRFVEAEGVLSLLEDQMPLTPELARLGVDVALTLGNHVKARLRALQPFNLASADYRIQTWLVDVYHRLADEEAAEALARQAVVRSPHTPDTWIALVRQLVRQDQRAEAAKVLDEAALKVSATALPRTLALGHEALGNLAKAEEILLRAVAEQPGEFNAALHAVDFLERTDQLGKAEPILRRLLTPGSFLPREYAPRLIRLQALALAEDPSRRDQALALVKAETPANVRTRALILGKDPRKHDEAVKLFRSTLKKSPASDDEMFGLARMHEDAGKAFEATEMLLKLLVYQPENPRYLASLIVLLAGQDRGAEAEPLFTRLERLEPSSPRTQRARAALGKRST